MGIRSLRIRRIRMRMERPIIRFFEYFIQIGYSVHSVLSHVVHTVVIRCSIRHIQYFVFNAIKCIALHILHIFQLPSKIVNMDDVPDSPTLIDAPALWVNILITRDEDGRIALATSRINL